MNMHCLKFHCNVLVQVTLTTTFQRNLGKAVKSMARPLKISIFQALDANANAGIGIIIRRASEIAESKVACALWLIYFGAVGQ